MQAVRRSAAVTEAMKVALFYASVARGLAPHRVEPSRREMGEEIIFFLAFRSKGAIVESHSRRDRFRATL